MAMLQPPQDKSQMDSLLSQMGEMKATMGFVLSGQTKLQEAMMQIIPRGEHEARWAETDRRCKALEEDVHELQNWRNSFYAQNGNDRVELTKDLSSLGKRADERTISLNQALIGMLIMTLLGLLAYIAQHSH